MKYQIPTERIPQNQRREVNEKILFLVENNICEENNITKNDVYSSFTGKGSLHNLDFNDYDSYHEYSEAKKIEEVGQFFTPSKICQFIVECIKPSETDLISDLTFGMGNFFNFCPNESNVYGTELDIVAYKIAKYLYPDANLLNEDIRLYDPKIKFDIVLGNPPFGLKWKYKKEEYISQLFYFIKSAEVLNTGGLLALIVPSSFLADQFMNGKMIRQIDELFNFIAQFELPKNAFKDVGVASFETKIMFFQKKSDNLKEVKYSSGIEKVSIDEKNSQEIYEKYIRPIQEEKRKLHAKILLENISNSSSDKTFQYQVKKLLWDIKNSKHTKSKYAKAMNYVNEFYNQKCPPDMGYEEWAKIRITESKVLTTLKKILRDQHLVERDEIRLVKDNYRLRLKAYSGKTRYQLGRSKEDKSGYFNALVLNDNYPFDDLTYAMLIYRKRVKYLKNELKFKDLDKSHLGEIDTWLKEQYIYKHSTDEKIQLTEIQRLDTASMIYKGKGILDWSMGCGKSLAAIFWYRYFKSQVRNTFIVGPAIAIKLTWAEILSDYREDFILIDSLEKINSIKQSQIVLISYDMLRKYERQIKKFVKILNNKITLVVDESDETSNANSKRSRTVKNCFRKVHKILQTTGSVTRNNINELYPQLELLYNNSIGMLCTCPSIYKYNNKKDFIDEEFNEYYMKPFPAKYGNGLFKSCFNPYRQSVFGIKKHDQNVYNKDHLTDLIQRSIITRNFFEIVGTKPNFISKSIEQNSSEKNVYRFIIEEFYKIVRDHFNNTGNQRKESALRIIRQIQLLLKASALPELFKEYSSNQIPNKELEVMDLVINKYSNEKVAIGTVFKKEADKYFNKISKKCPDRKVFLIKGDVTFKERKNIISEFESTKNGIMVSTQSSLKSSVNIPSCNIVIVTSLMWNMPKILQYVFRFIRFNSKNIDSKKIYFVVYKDSLEMNILALLMSKEKLNQFIKGMDYNNDQIFDEYGIDINILDEILEKVTETVEGKSKVVISWGKQKIV